MSNKNNEDLALENVSRRFFLKGVASTGALVIAAKWGVVEAAEKTQEKAARKYGADAMPNGWVDSPDVFIHLGSDGRLTFVCHRSEMGQGIRTSLAMVAADELGVDWEKVIVEQAEGDEKTYGNQNTDGSRSMRHWFDPIRRAAAAARTMLEHAAADVWQVPVAEVEAGVQMVAHKASNKTLSFAQLAEKASQLEVPKREGIVLKNPDKWRYIGKMSGPAADMPHNKILRPKAIDGEAIVQGEAIYGADVVRENMLFAVIARPPVYGAKVKSFDASAAKKIKGVERVVEVKGTGQPAAFNPLGGVAVLATSTWAAIQGRNALKIEWDNTPAGDNASYDSETYRQALIERSRSPGKVIRSKGDVKKAFAEANKVVEATYYMPHMAHAPMEPPAAVVEIVDGHAQVWAPVQNPQATKDTVAGHLGLDPSKVTVNVTLLGGGFGRKSKPDFAVEAASLSQTMGGRPVRVQWTREDDIHNAYFHTVSVDYLKAAIDKTGKVSGWQHRTLAPTITSLFAPDPEHKAVFELGMGFSTLPFDLPALQLENPEAPAHVRIGWFRSVYNIPHAFAIQCFACELAAAAKQDHRDFLLELLGPARQIDPRSIGDEWNYGESPEKYPLDIGRMRRVIETATGEASWGKKRPKGRGLGLAVHYSFVSYAAVVLDVEVDARGEVIVHRADIAFDCGPQINPERIRSQLEGSVVMGIGIALLNNITAKDGKIQQDNFHQFEVPRMMNAPKEVHVHLVGGDDPSAPLGGVGEPGLPPVAPALCNAVFAATGKRIRELPIGRQLKA